jgi:glutamate 5-kinase
VKIGTDVITDRRGNFREGWMKHIVAQVAELRKAGKQVVIVTSGARAKGMAHAIEMGIPVAEEDATLHAMMGQPELMAKYREFFREHGIAVGQVLPSRRDFRNRDAVRQFRENMLYALGKGVVPILNENDPLSRAELAPLSRRHHPTRSGKIVFGDNDVLSAGVASVLKADLLVMLTDVPGIYDRDPTKHRDAKLYGILRGVPDALVRRAEQATGGGRGGTKTKFHAARIAIDDGIPVVVAHGWKRNVLLEIVRGVHHGTLIVPHK